MNSLSAQLTLTVVRLSSLIVQFSGGGGCASFSPVTIPGTPSSASFLYSYLHARVWFLREVYFDFMKKVRISPVRGWRKGCLVEFFLREGEGGRLSGESSKREIGLSFFRGCCVAKGFFSFFLSFEFPSKDDDDFEVLRFYRFRIPFASRWWWAQRWQTFFPFFFVERFSLLNISEEERILRKGFFVASTIVWELVCNSECTIFVGNCDIIWQNFEEDTSIIKFIDV